MKLPNGERAIIDLAKLRDYCLNPRHPIGRHKARVFKTALGFDQSRAQELRQILIQVASTQDAQLAEKDDFGQRYVIDFALPAVAAQVGVRSCWIVLSNEEVPRLTSCFVLTWRQTKP
jgi:hypothetical protein